MSFLNKNIIVLLIVFIIPLFVYILVFSLNHIGEVGFVPKAIPFFAFILFMIYIAVAFILFIFSILDRSLNYRFFHFIGFVFLFTCISFDLNYILKKNLIYVNLLVFSEDYEKKVLLLQKNEAASNKKKIKIEYSDWYKSSGMFFGGNSEAWIVYYDQENMKYKENYLKIAIKKIGRRACSQDYYVFDRYAVVRATC